MNSLATAAPKQSWSKRHGKRALLVAAIVALILVATAGALLATKWPFTPEKVTAELASATSGRMQIHGFRVKYFPPGCVIDGVELRQSGDSSGPPLLTAGKLTIRSNYRGLLHKRLEFMHLEDVRVDMSQRANHSRGDSSSSSTTDWASIAEITVDRAVIEFPRKKGPLRFNVHRLTLGNFVSGKPTSFHATLDNPLPPGLVGVDGQFGPWNSSDIAATPLSGSYTFTDAKLSSLGGIAGTLSSKGSFAGPARALRVQGSTDTPNFEVKSAGHPVHLRTEFEAVVNCTNGDVKLPGIRGQFGKTTFTVAGDVVGKSNNPHAKVASLQVNDPGGRVEDWLHLLAPDETPPMTGPISFQARVTIPGGPQPFLRRVRLQGDFELTAVEFTKEKSQRGAAELSLRARGQKVSDAEPLPKIPGRLSGHVELLDGVANFSTLTFALPGAVADVRGTYSFNDEKVDLHGQLRIDTKFSKTAGGPKAVLTRATEALWAHSKGDGEVLPVKMTGTYDHPSYGLDK
jgi:hypothetical protein